MPLLDRAKQAQQAKAANVAKATGGDGTEEFTPEEKAAYEQGLDVATKLLYEQQGVGEKIAEMIQTGDPAQAIGDAAALLTKQADDALQGQLPETVIIPIGVRLVGEIADMAEELGLIQADQPMMQKAVQVAMKTLFQDYGVDEAALGEAQGLAQKFGGDSEFAGALQQAGQQDAPQGGQPQ